MLESFCAYSNRLNPKDDLSDPRHWDIGEQKWWRDKRECCESVVCLGILVTGLDLWREKNGIRDDDTLGLARTKGMCHHKFSCAVGQLVVRSLLSQYSL